MPEAGLMVDRMAKCNKQHQRGAVLRLLVLCILEGLAQAKLYLPQSENQGKTKNWL